MFCALVGEFELGICFGKFGRGCLDFRISCFVDKCGSGASNKNIKGLSEELVKQRGLWKSNIGV